MKTIYEIIMKKHECSLEEAKELFYKYNYYKFILTHEENTGK